MFCFKVSFSEFLNYLLGVLTNVLFKRFMSRDARIKHHERHKNVFEIKVVYDFIRQLKGSFAKTGKNNLIRFVRYDNDFVFLLRRKSSDFAVFRQIFIDEEYRWIFSLDKKNIKYIIDAGSNIGLATVLFYKHFSNPVILSIEPEHGNFECLVRNLQLNHCENVIPLNCGIWSQDTFISPDRNFRDKRNWAFTLVRHEIPEKNTIPVYSLCSLMEKYNFPQTDLLKMDIEGGEYEIFDSDSDISFLKKTKALIAELHDDREKNEKIRQLLKINNFDVTSSAEYTVAVNKAWIK